MSDYLLYGNPGWGSAIVEAQLDWYELPYRYVATGDLFASDQARQQLLPHNALAQVPTLILPDGRVMTESAAITLYLADVTQRDDLVPGPHATERAEFLRWLVFLVANVYPTFTYADDPARFVKTEGAGDAFRREVDAYAQRLWRLLDGAAGTPHFLGTRLSALDIYLAVMTRWRPNRTWFREHAPRITAIVGRMDDDARLNAMNARNFPPR